MTFEFTHKIKTSSPSLPYMYIVHEFRMNTSRFQIAIFFVILVHTFIWSFIHKTCGEKKTSKYLNGKNTYSMYTTKCTSIKGIIVNY